MITTVLQIIGGVHGADLLIALLAVGAAVLATLLIVGVTILFYAACAFLGWLRDAEAAEQKIFESEAE